MTCLHVAAERHNPNEKIFEALLKQDPSLFKIKDNVSKFKNFGCKDLVLRV